GPAFLRKLERRPSLATPQAVPEVRPHDRESLGRHRPLLPPGEQGSLGLRRGPEQQNPHDPTSFLWPARRGVLSPENPRLHAPGNLKIQEKLPTHFGEEPLFVEPRLIGNLDVVSVRVADVCREVVGTPFGPKARFLDWSSSRVYRRLVAGPAHVRALGGASDVKVFGDFAILQPETRIAIDGETEKSIELVGHVDAKRLKHLLVEFARPIQIRDGEVNMINHGVPLFA